jgi:hypothetical protein
LSGFFRGGHRAQRLVKPGTYTPVHSVSISPSSFSIVAATTQQLTATVKDIGNNILQGRVVDWASNNAAIATVNAFGLVTGVAAGNCTITATCEGVNANSACTITAQNVVDASQSTVTAQSPVNTGASSTVTVTTKRSDGTALSGQTVTLAVSGSNNSITQPSGTTNGSGVITGSFSSTTAETKTVTATGGGVVISQQPSVVVQGGLAPYLNEDFSTYSSTANWIADPRGIYSTAEDVNTAMMVLDTSVGCTPIGTSQTGRYDWPDRTGEGGSGTTGRCSDDTIGRNLNLPAHQTELWVGLYWKTQSSFTTVAPGGWGCTSAAAYKLLFLRTDVSRYNLVLGIFGTSYTWSAGPGNQEPADYPLDWTPFDGNWHYYQMHVKIGSGSNGICNLAVDGVVRKTNTGLSQGGASYIYGIATGRNMNQGPGAPQSEWWGQVAAYTSDPWGGLV